MSDTKNTARDFDLNALAQIMPPGVSLNIDPNPFDSVTLELFVHAWGVSFRVDHDTAAATLQAVVFLLEQQHALPWAPLGLEVVK